MNELRAKFLHERELYRNLQNPARMAAVPIEGEQEPTVMMTAREGQEYIDPEYVEYLERELAMHLALCEQQAEMILQNPSLIPQGGPDNG